MEKFDKEWNKKEAKMELELMKIPLTTENIEEKYHELYAMWLAEQANDAIHSDDGIDDTISLFDLFQNIDYKYYCLIEQMLENQPFHYKGKYFNFEEIYNKEKFNKQNFGLGYDIYMLVKTIRYFEKCEQDMNNYENLTTKIVNDFKRGLEYGISRIFFID